MAALSHFPPHFLSLSSHYHPSSSLSFSSQYTSHSNQTHFNGKHSIVCLASSKKSRPSRKLMSDEDLCKSLQDFVALVGLPADHVPSTKQLSEHGRKDLANIVRRRGHKQINDLLANFTKTATDGHDLNGNLYGELIGSNTPDNSGQEEKVIDTCEESVDLIDNDSAVNGSLFTTSESVASSDNVYSSPIESHSLQEKVEKFMRYGLLDAVDDDLCSDLKRIDVEHGKASDHQNISDMVHMRLAGSNDTGLNGTVVLRRPVYSPVIEETSSTFYLSTRRQQNTDFEGESAETSKLENELEISRLKHMLHQKELELSRLKDEVEREKQTLSFLQTKVEDEISSAQKLIAEKEAELLAAEESLSGLLEAKIQYSGEGDLVEVAGSFNGWHQRIKMDPQISSAIIDPINTRKSRLWSTTLWLYPGIYEIKFIVDGQWKIDPNRETTFRGGLENNILRVDR